MAINKGTDNQIIDFTDSAKNVKIESGIVEVNSVDIDMNSNKITNLPENPTDQTDAASKAYVDSKSMGLDEANQFVSCTTAVNVNYATIPSGTGTYNGVALVADDRVLFWNQTASETNGIYVVASGVWTRATDLNETSEAVVDKWVIVLDGLINKNTIWAITTAPAALGTDPLVFSNLSSGTTAPALEYVLARGNSAGAYTINMNNQKITSLATPTAASDAATMGYVDGLSYQHENVKYATTGALPGAPTYSAGVLTQTTGVGTALSIDGHTFDATDVTNGTRILVRNETSATTDNGIFVYTQHGTGATPWKLTRATDWAVGFTFKKGEGCYVTDGSSNMNFAFYSEAAGAVDAVDPAFDSWDTLLDSKMPLAGGTFTGVVYSTSSGYYCNSSPSYFYLGEYGNALADIQSNSIIMERRDATGAAGNGNYVNDMMRIRGRVKTKSDIAGCVAFGYHNGAAGITSAAGYDLASFSVMLRYRAYWAYLSAAHFISWTSTTSTGEIFGVGFDDISAWLNPVIYFYSGGTQYVLGPSLANRFNGDYSWNSTRLSDDLWDDIFFTNNAGTCTFNWYDIDGNQKSVALDTDVSASVTLPTFAAIGTQFAGRLETTLGITPCFNLCDIALFDADEPDSTFKTFHNNCDGAYLVPGDYGDLVGYWKCDEANETVGQTIDLIDSATAGTNDLAYTVSAILYQDHTTYDKEHRNYQGGNMVKMYGNTNTTDTAGDGPLVEVGFDYTRLNLNGSNVTMDTGVIQVTKEKYAGAAIAGTTTLVAGTATVATTAVTADSIIRLHRQDAGLGVLGNLSVARTAGTQIVISSDAVTDVSTVAWEIIEPV